MFALVDCNNFYASCEQLFDPRLQKRPLVVLSSNDGCVIARSKEAKNLGIPMGAPFYQYESFFLQHGVEKRSSNFTLYGDLSRRVIETLQTFALPIEVYSIDEAFLLVNSFTCELAEMIQKRVKQWTGIPVSIGLGPSKTLAKVANRLSKKREDLIVFTSGKDADSELKTFPVEEVWGIGRCLKKKLYSHGILTAYDLKMQSDAWIKKHLSVLGLKTVWELRGIPCLECEEMPQKKKSITASRSFRKEITALEDLKKAVSTFIGRAASRMRRQQLEARFLHVFIQKNRFKELAYSSSASVLLPLPTAYPPDLMAAAHRLLESLFENGAAYKKAGVFLGELTSEEETQMDFFSADPKKKKKHRLMKAFDAINTRFDATSLCFASEHFESKSAYRSPSYTTSWDALPIVKI